MKKVFKNPTVMFLLGALIFSSISVYAARKYYASDITYKETTLDKALDTLYTTQNTTVINLQNQVSSLTSANVTLTNEKTALQSQVNEKNATISSLQSQLELSSTSSKSFTFTSSTSTQTFDLGFKPENIYCISNYNSSAGNGMLIVSYNKNYSTTNVARAADSSVGKSIGAVGISSYFTINDNGFTWNIASSGMTGSTVYCTASK